MRHVIQRCKSRYQNQSRTTGVLIWIALIMVIGIVIRWNYIIPEVTRGFLYFKK